MTRLTLLAVLALAVWLTVPGEPEAAGDVREPGYLRVPNVMTAATPVATAVEIGSPGELWEEFGVMRLSFYSCDPREGTGACVNRHTGTRPEEGRTVASPDLPPGTRLYISGFGERIVEDFCGGCEPGEMDVFIDDHDRANELGIKHANVRLQRVAE